MKHYININIMVRVVLVYDLHQCQFMSVENFFISQTVREQSLFMVGGS